MLPSSSEKLSALSTLSTSYLCNLPRLYSNADTAGKRAITCSIYPEKPAFDGIAFRTPRLNSIAEFICLTNRILNKKKDRHETSKVSNVSLVTPEVQFSNTFVEDLNRLAELSTVNYY